MRQTPGRARPAARRGLGAVVLLALLALLHAAFSPGSAHLPALDLDGCLRRSVAPVAAQACDAAPAAVLTGAGAGGHQDGDASQSCDASAYGPRQLAHLSHVPMTTGDAPGDGTGPSAHRSSLGVAPSPPLGTASGPIVLRC